MLLFTIRIVFPPDYRNDIPPGKTSSYLSTSSLGTTRHRGGALWASSLRATPTEEMCFVAAGARMAPMRSHIFDQLIR